MKAPCANIFSFKKLLLLSRIHITKVLMLIRHLSTVFYLTTEDPLRALKTIPLNRWICRCCLLWLSTEHQKNLSARNSSAHINVAASLRRIFVSCNQLSIIMKSKRLPEKGSSKTTLSVLW